MKLREYRSGDCASLAGLFFHTVHTVNSKDYSADQLDAWATGNVDTAAWNDSFLKHTTIVAEIHGIITGFGEMDQSGYLDKLYIHKDYQGKGIAAAIVNELEQQTMQRGTFSFTTHASITARPFFEKQGYLVVRENQVIRSGIRLTNFIMEKN